MGNAPHTLMTTHAATDIVLRHPAVCPRCQAFTAWFRNQDGHTYCIQCVPDQSEAWHDVA